MSKGQKRRPASVSEDKIQENWDKIFNKKKKKLLEVRKDLEESLIRDSRIENQVHDPKVIDEKYYHHITKVWDKWM